MDAPPELTTSDDVAPLTGTGRRTRVVRALTTQEFQPWRYAIVVVVFTRIAFIGASYLAQWLTAGGHGKPAEGIRAIWNRWDATNLIAIAQDGYGDPATSNSAAYFPLFPKLIAALRALRIDPAIAGMAINALACVVAFAFLYKLAYDAALLDATSAEDSVYAHTTGRRAVLLLALFPTSVFLVAPYTEPIFLAGAIPAFYYARRGRWNLVGVLAAVAVGARFAGLLLLAGLAAEFLRQRNFVKQQVVTFTLAMVTAVTPFLYYMLLLNRISGNPWLFVEAQRRGWGRGFAGPIDSFRNTWRIAFDRNDYPTNWIMGWRLEILFALAGLLAVLWMLRKREYGYAAFCGAVLLVMATNAWYYSIPRALLTFFPIPILLALAIGRRPRLYEPVLLGFAAFSIVGVVAYTRGAWFF